ncbi:MAG: DNA-binding domain-containing protein [Pseudomonadota bacterium]
MTVSQNTFREALLDAERPVPPGLSNAEGGPAGARFSVYRNNVVVSLSEALKTAFPLVRKLLGAEAFAQLAAVFVRAHPPTSPLIMFYGDALPDFLRSFEPLQHIGYLPDCARLDLAFRQSYHAADALPFDASVLQGGDAGLAARARLAPATRLLRSEWPLYDIWRFNMEPGAPKPRAVAQDIMVTRPEFDPQPTLVPAGTIDWLALLDEGATIGDATDWVLSSHPDFDLAKALTLALTTHALTDHTTKER